MVYIYKDEVFTDEEAAFERFKDLADEDEFEYHINDYFGPIEIRGCRYDAADVLREFGDFCSEYDDWVSEEFQFMCEDEGVEHYGMYCVAREWKYRDEWIDEDAAHRIVREVCCTDEEYAKATRLASLEEVNVCGASFCAKDVMGALASLGYDHRREWADQRAAYFIKEIEGAGSSPWVPGLIYAVPNDNGEYPDLPYTGTAVKGVE